MTDVGDLGQRESLVAPPPSAAALRMRRCREHRRRAMRCVTIELRETEIAALVRKGHLGDEARNDLRALRDALYSFLDQKLSP